ncbi:MAG TPA: hypothetical protein VGE32_05665 [Cellvibrio sp.]
MNRSRKCLISLPAFGLCCLVALGVEASELPHGCIAPDCLTVLSNADGVDKDGTNKDNNNKPVVINIRIHPIFDESLPAENNFLFRLANRLHIDTHEKVVARDLLVEDGDYLDASLLAESERILRTRHYFNSASVTSIPEEEGQVNVDVREVWTLLPSVSYSHTGGKTSSGLGLRDSNFLGYGKTVSIVHNSSAERSGDSFDYFDPNTGWHQTTLGLSYDNNSDGQRRKVEFIRPYFSLSTVNAGGITYEQFDREDSVYNAGEIVSLYGHSADKREFFYGAKLAFSNKHNIHRWNVGYAEEEDVFFNLQDTNELLVPRNRHFNTTWIEYSYIQDGYIEANNIQQINRIEDINLGLESRVRIGHADSIYPEYDNTYQLTQDLSQGFLLSPASLLLASIHLDGRYNQGRVYNGLVEGKIAYHWQNFPAGQLYVSLQGARGLRLFGDHELSLGGDMGLRGYPAFYETGDKRYLLTLEQRFYGEREWFSLFHMGYAVFYDQGRAWGDSLIPQTQTGQLRDVGIGLRISGTRTGSRDDSGHNVLHIDLATPLDGGGEVSQLQWLVKVKSSF